MNQIKKLQGPKPMGVRSTVYPPKKTASFNEWIEENEARDFERIWAEFKNQIKQHRTRNL